MNNFRGIVREIKSFIRTDSFIKRIVLKATSNNSEGPSESQLSVIENNVRYSNDDLQEVMCTIFDRLNDERRENWRHVYKSLRVLEFLINKKIEGVIDECLKGLDRIRELCDISLGRDYLNQEKRIRELAVKICTQLEEFKGHSALFGTRGPFGNQDFESSSQLYPAIRMHANFTNNNDCRAYPPVPFSTPPYPQSIAEVTPTTNLSPHLNTTHNAAPYPVSPTPDRSNYSLGFENVSRAISGSLNGCSPSAPEREQ
ncbi:uncharacterized protein LOC136032456 [Artemia franciscana]|uniref:ENTH domain-containing protein n=1 Tax=Artemia franciscana TaxID=6661 RepID=A0AA88IMD5_ARTSF|nr:hypothetical protein QYM36_000782 [Artemia franciscana]